MCGAWNVPAPDRSPAMHRSGTRHGLALALQAAAWLFAFASSRHRTCPGAGETLPWRGPAHDRIRQEDFRSTGRSASTATNGTAAATRAMAELALSLRKTQLTAEQLAGVIRCGRPTTGMPIIDQFAYTDKRCYDYTKADLGKDMPPMATEFAAEARGRRGGEVSVRPRGRPWSRDLRGLRRLLGQGNPAMRSDETEMTGPA